LLIAILVTGVESYAADVSEAVIGGPDLGRSTSARQLLEMLSKSGPGQPCLDTPTPRTVRLDA